jgi:UDP:flavonoid glycosyltransferase YjiC (YdhE family)
MDQLLTDSSTKARLMKMKAIFHSQSDCTKGADFIETFLTRGCVSG